MAPGVSVWGRLNSFRFAPRPRVGDGERFLRELRAFAEDSGLPLVIQGEPRNHFRMT